MSDLRAPVFGIGTFLLRPAADCGWLWWQDQYQDPILDR